MEPSLACVATWGPKNFGVTSESKKLEALSRRYFMDQRAASSFEFRTVNEYRAFGAWLLNIRSIVEIPGLKLNELWNLIAGYQEVFVEQFDPNGTFDKNSKFLDWAAVGQLAPFGADVSNFSAIPRDIQGGRVAMRNTS